MRRILLIAAAILCLAGCSNNKTAQCGRHGMMDEDGWFIVQDITPADAIGSVYLISEHYAGTCYLVTGTKRALLIDTGIGVGSLSSLVATLTDLPLEVVNTHGHIDHVGANYQFLEAWMPEKDMALYESMNPVNNPDLDAYVAGQAKDFPYDIADAAEMCMDVRRYEPCEVKTFNEGKTWDLGGGKVLTAIELGGHTSGSMMFMDEADNMLFSGDAMNGYLWMWLDHSLSLEEYEANLARVIPQIEHLGAIYGGHELRPEGVPMAHAAEMLADVRAALAGDIAPVITPAPMGTGTVNVYHFDTWLLWAK